MAIHCLVVTPERTELDVQVDFLTLPMFDGELGVGEDRAAMIGRLGFGTLKLRTSGNVEKYFVDGGFAQVEKNGVSVLTNRLLPIDQVNRSEAESALEEAIAMPATTSNAATIRENAILRARGLMRVSR